MTECYDTQDARDKDTEAPLKRALIDLFGEEGANVVIYPAEPHTDRFSKPVSQSVDQERDKRERRQIQRIEIDQQRYDYKGSRDILRRQPVLGVGSVLGPIIGEEHGPDNSAPLLERLDKDGKCADGDDQSECLCEYGFLADEHYLQDDRQEEDREMIDLSCVIHFYSFMTNQLAGSIVEAKQDRYQNELIEKKYCPWCTYFSEDRL